MRVRDFGVRCATLLMLFSVAAGLAGCGLSRGKALKLIVKDWGQSPEYLEFIENPVRMAGDQGDLWRILGPLQARPEEIDRIGRALMDSGIVTQVVVTTDGHLDHRAFSLTDKGNLYFSGPSERDHFFVNKVTRRHKLFDWVPTKVIDIRIEGSTARVQYVVEPKNLSPLFPLFRGQRMGLGGFIVGEPITRSATFVKSDNGWRIQ